MDKQHLAYARQLDTQHPSTWAPGQWYPATNPDGSKVEIKRTRGKGRNQGSFLHVRKPTRLVIVDRVTGKRTQTGLTDYIHARINLATGDYTWLS